MARRPSQEEARLIKEFSPGGSNDILAHRRPAFARRVQRMHVRFGSEADIGLTGLLMSPLPPEQDIGLRDCFALSALHRPTRAGLGNVLQSMYGTPDLHQMRLDGGGCF